MSILEQVKMSPAACLPFVIVDQETGKVTNFWNVTPSDDWGDDCEAGRAFAYDLIDLIADTGLPGILSWVASAMPTGDARTGIETGFWHVIATAASRH